METRDELTGASGGGAGHWHSDGAGADAHKPWYRRRAVLVAGVVVVVGLITVISDLPVHGSRSQDIAEERTVIDQVNTDVAPCALAIHESLAFYQAEVDHTLSAADKATAPGFLRDDQAACSFTNETIYDLSTIEVPGSAAGKHIGNVVSITTLWATSDALGAIEDVQALDTDAANASARSDLAKRLRSLAADRAQVDDQMKAADQVLSAKLPMPALPSEPQVPPPA